MAGNLYYTSDQGEEFQYLIAFDLATGEKDQVLKKDWDIVYTYFSESGKYRITGINQDGQNVIEILDTESGESLEAPDVGEREVTSVNISNSEERMTLYAGDQILQVISLSIILNQGNLKN